MGSNDLFELWPSPLAGPGAPICPVSILLHDLGVPKGRLAHKQGCVGLLHGTSSVHGLGVQTAARAEWRDRADGQKGTSPSGKHISEQPGATAPGKEPTLGNGLKHETQPCTRDWLPLSCLFLAWSVK